MFNNARLKLTIWYLLIIMSISIFFSVAIYYLLNREVNDNYVRFYRRYQLQQLIDPSPFGLPPPDQTIIEDSTERILGSLGIINIFILIVSASAGYFLAGRTLKPIENMIDDQNRFVADASHELRTPLTAQKTTIEVNLRDELLTLPQAKEILRDNLNDIANLQRLSDELLDLAQWQNGDTALELQGVNLNKLITGVIDLVKKSALLKNITIEANFEDKIINVDHDKIARLLVILLDNAIKYSPVASNVVITAAIIDHRLKFEVTDHGIGINKEDQTMIFDRFFRSDKSRSQSGGYGLGLAIAKKIVDQHHGTITVASKLAQGSTFTISLPQ
ncbi:MAG: ATP-binding protein [candidate division WWE3 bacterium]|nr:ATP-binding protein [candidate division WWE3 bacterium]